MPSASPDDALIVETVCFTSGPYRLEGELAYAGAGPPRAGVVIAGAHPLLGGTRSNNVVRALGDGLAEHGLPSLRFDYRGSGRSEGPPLDTPSHLAHFWRTQHVPDEPVFGHDLAAAVAFLGDVLGPDVPLVLIGYSFGCSLLPRAGAGHLVPLVLVAPTVGTHDYHAFATLRNPLLVIAPENDFAADAGRLRAWFDGLVAPRRLVQGRWDNHFFRGHEAWLVGMVLAFLKEQGAAFDGASLFS
jgi:alpha/beta superfamily hydrolase